MVAIFGGTGAIGSALIDWYLNAKWRVICIGRSSNPGVTETESSFSFVHWDPVGLDSKIPKEFPHSVDAIVWAQGSNCSDNIYSYDRSQFNLIIESNVVYILETLHQLIASDRLTHPCRMVVISSIWQTISRNNKLSYMISKAALRGVVGSLSIDIADQGHMVNAVLPGVLDTPMTHRSLSDAEIGAIIAGTPNNSLTDINDVCNLTAFLTSDQNTGITGQFITADRGYSCSRLI